MAAAIRSTEQCSLCLAHSLNSLLVIFVSDVAVAAVDGAVAVAVVDVVVVVLFNCFRCRVTHSLLDVGLYVQWEK